MSRSLLTLKFTIITLFLISSGVMSQSGDRMKGFRRLLPRDGIPSIKNPKYVTAKEADISDNAWILGVVIDGQARAYSLNILNHHEIVNDRINDTNFAAVW